MRSQESSGTNKLFNISGPVFGTFYTPKANFNKQVDTCLALQLIMITTFYPPLYFYGRTIFS